MLRDMCVLWQRSVQALANRPRHANPNPLQSHVKDAKSRSPLGIALMLGLPVVFGGSRAKLCTRRKRLHVSAVRGALGSIALHSRNLCQICLSSLAISGRTNEDYGLPTSVRINFVSELRLPRLAQQACPGQSTRVKGGFQVRAAICCDQHGQLKTAVRP